MNKIRIIAELGSNWLGQPKLIYEAIPQVAEAGADGIKFQIGLDRLYSQERAPGIWQRLQPYAFPCHLLPSINDYAHEYKLDVWASFFDLELLEQWGDWVDGLKVASGDLTNRKMLDMVTEMAKNYDDLPVAVSTGAGIPGDIETALEYLERVNHSILMQCNSEYPAASLSANLRNMLPYQDSVDEIGYSDHTLGNVVAPIAVGMGYTFFEKHFSPLQNITLASPDACVSIDRYDFANYIKAIRLAEQICGSRERVISIAEQKERLWARRGSDGLRPVDGVSESDNSL